MKNYAEKLLYSRKGMRNLPALLEEYAPGEGAARYQKVLSHLTKLLEEFGQDSKGMRMHTHQRILPMIALYTGLCEVTEKEKALAMAEEIYLADAYRPAKILRGILKIPGFYKKVPNFFTAMTKKSFGEAYGFRAKYHQSDNKGMVFDMLRCPYFDICKRHGCPELTRAFCRADDIMYQNMHPKLRWARTTTIGQGAKLCDFRIYVRNE